MNLEKSSEYFFNQNSIDSNNLDFLDEKISDFISNPSITTESIHNFFSEPEFGYSFNNNKYDDIDSFILYFQNKLKSIYFNDAIVEILNILETQFPNFFQVNLSFLFFLQKLKFFQMLKQGKQKEADIFYNENLIRLLRESRPNQWKKKHKLYCSMIKKPSIFIKMDILEKYYGHFQYQLDNAIRNYLGGNNKQNTVKNQIEEDEINTDKNNDTEANIENESTKDNFSDFEDEIQFKLYNEENQDEKKHLIDDDIFINTHSNNYIFNNNLNDSTFEYNKLYFIDDQMDSNSSNKKINNNIARENNNSSNSIISTQNSFERKSKKVKKENNEDSLFKKLPILSSFKPKYTKRETIDKKIIRSFKQFIVNQYNQKLFDPNTSKDYSFFLILINNNILPPIDIYDVSSNEKIYFKSFNANFLLWFFSKQGIKELYSKFIQIEGTNFIDNISKYYEISEEERLSLINYFNNLPFIFDITLVNNLTNGKEINHIYRKKKTDNKNIKNSSYAMKKKLYKTRSRDLDNDVLNKSSSSNEE